MRLAVLGFLLLTGCGPLINLPSPTTGANIAPSPETQPALCNVMQPVYLDAATIALLPKDKKAEIAAGNRSWECVCDPVERKTKQCRLFLLSTGD